jgi:hypothetical protein
MKNWYYVRTKRYKEGWVAHQLPGSGNEQELKAEEWAAVLLDLLSSQIRVELPKAYIRKQSLAGGWQPAA